MRLAGLTDDIAVRDQLVELRQQVHSHGYGRVRIKRMLCRAWRREADDGE
jgi:hypothetical protein